MRKGILAIGIALIIFAIPGYTIGPGFITKEINKLTGGTDTHMASSILSQMGIPPIDEMFKITQYSFVGLGVAGIGAMVVGAVAKKPKRVFAKPKTKSVDNIEYEDMQVKSNPSNTLKERLARGEITSSQYQNLKRLLEEDQ